MTNTPTHSITENSYGDFRVTNKARGITVVITAEQLDKVLAELMAPAIGQLHYLPIHGQEPV